MKITIKLILLIFVITFLTMPAFCVNENKKEISINDIKNEEIREQAKILYMGNQISKAQTHIMTIPEEQRNAFDYYLIGLTSDKTGDEGLWAYKKAINLDENYYQAYYNIANIYYEREDYAQAANYYRLAVKKNDKFAYGHFNLGCTYLKLQDYNQARKSFESAIKLNSQEPDYYYNLGYTYKKMGNQKRADKAIKLYNELMKARLES